MSCICWGVIVCDLVEVERDSGTRSGDVIRDPRHHLPSRLADEGAVLKTGDGGVYGSCTM